MKILQILVLIFMFGSFTSIIEAQADCLFSFRLSVLDNKGKILNNGKVKFRERDIEYNSEIKAYSFSTLTGCNSKIIGLLKVTAPKFNKFEREIEVKGSFLSYELKLNAKDSKQSAIFEELAVISGMIKDANNGAISKVNIILTSESGERVEEWTNENGYYRLDVKAGKYKMDFIGTSGFNSRKYVNLVLSKGYKNLDVVLDFKRCDDPTINCSTVTTNQKNN